MYLLRCVSCTYFTGNLCIFSILITLEASVLCSANAMLSRTSTAQKWFSANARYKRLLCYLWGQFVIIWLTTNGNPQSQPEETQRWAGESRGRDLRQALLLLTLSSAFLFARESKEATRLCVEPRVGSNKTIRLGRDLGHGSWECGNSRSLAWIGFEWRTSKCAIRSIRAFLSVRPHRLIVIWV